MNLDKLRKIFTEIGIQRGDSILLTSEVLGLWNLFREANNEFNPESIITCLQEIITAEGTILIPTYNWNICENKFYDYNRSKSKTGALGNVSLKMPGFKRTYHPIYSFAVWGKKSDIFLNMDNRDSFGMGSPFDYFYKNNFKNIFIDTGFAKGFTFIHYVEQCCNANYRFIKEFDGEYVDENGNTKNCSCSMFVRYLDIDVKFADHIDEFLENTIIDKEVVVNGVIFRSVDFRKAFDVIAEDIINNKARNIVSYLNQ